MDLQLNSFFSGPVTQGALSHTAIVRIRRTAQNSRRNRANPRNGGRYGSRRKLSERVFEFERANGLKVCSGLSLLTRATSGPLRTNRLLTIRSGGVSEKTDRASFSRHAAVRLSSLTASVFATTDGEIRICLSSPNAVVSDSAVRIPIMYAVVFILFHLA